MRRLLSGIMIVLLLPAILCGQDPRLRIEHIQAPEVEVRSGPTDKFPVTGVLRKGARVFVRSSSHLAAKDWLAIVPPEGSVSWVPLAVVKFVGPSSGNRQPFAIVGDPKDPLVPIHAGLAGGTEPLSVQLQEVPRGTQGYIRGKAVKPTWDERKWYPIDPLPGELRFIHARALQEPGPNDLALAKTKAALPGQLTSLPGRDATALFQKARQADDAGRVQEAIELYQQVAREVSASNDGLANHCATRIYELRQRRSQAPGTLTSRSGDPGEPPLPGSSSFTPPASVVSPNNLRQTGAGFLRRTSFTIDGRSTYALDDRNRRVIFYVTPEPTINLEPYVGRWVDLHGIVDVRGDVRGGEYMRVVKVTLLK